MVYLLFNVSILRLSLLSRTHVRLSPSTELLPMTGPSRPSSTKMTFGELRWLLLPRKGTVRLQRTAARALRLPSVNTLTSVAESTISHQRLQRLQRTLIVLYYVLLRIPGLVRMELRGSRRACMT